MSFSLCLSPSPLSPVCRGINRVSARSTHSLLLIPTGRERAREREREKEREREREREKESERETQGADEVVVQM